MYLSKLSVQVSSWGARHSACLTMEWQAMASLCMATEQPAADQKAGDSKFILVITVDEIRNHLGALRVRAFLWSVTKSSNKGPDLISCAV